MACQILEPVDKVLTLYNNKYRKCKRADCEKLLSYIMDEITYENCNYISNEID